MSSSLAAPRSAAVDMVGCALVWGAFFAVGKLAVADASPLVVATLRHFFATLLLVPLLAWREPEALRLARRDLPLVVALGFTGVALYNICAFIGFSLAPASDGAMISPTLNPVITAVVAALLFGEELTRHKLLGLVLALGGVAAIFVGPALAAESGPTRLAGDALFVVSALAWSAYTLLGRVAVSRFSPLANSTYASLAGLLLLAPVSAVELGRVAWGELPLSLWLAVLFLAVFSTVVGLLLWYSALAKIGAARTASYLPLVPVFGVLSSVVALGERPTPVQLGGMALAVGGVWWGNRPREA